MKAQILKIAGVKNEKDFYKKFPTEEAFMAKHGGAFEKAQYGYNTPGFVQEWGMNPQTPYQNSFNNELPAYTPLSQPNVNQTANNSLTTPTPSYNNKFNPQPLQYGNGQISNSVFANRNQQINELPSGPKESTGTDNFGFAKSVPILGGVVKGFQALADEKEARRVAKQNKLVSDVTLQASTTRPEQIKRQYVRPEDIPLQPNQLFPTYGVGTNALAKDGINLKKYDEGGGIGGGVLGGGGFGENPYGNMVGSMFDNNGGSQIGGSVGSIFGPVGGAVGSFAGGILDDNQTYIDRYNKQTNRNIKTMMMNSAIPSIQAGYASHLEDGGTVSQMESGGDLNTHWGGEAELMSYNPYLPDSGETVMFKGDSHADGGIGITYGKNKVEVEGGEPAVQLPEGDGTNLTVFGNLPITAEYSSILGDKSATGKKFKTYIANLSNKEAKQNKLIDKTSQELTELPVVTSFDKLKLSTLQANLTGANMTLKSVAARKINAANLQNAINDTAEENGLSAEHLAKGQVRKAKNGISMKAQFGTNVDPGLELYYKTKGVNPGMIDYNKPDEQINPIFQGDNYVNTWMPKVYRTLSEPDKAKQVVSNLENYSGQDYQDVRDAIGKGQTFDDKLNITQRLATDRKIGPYHNLVDLGKARRDSLLVAPAATVPDAEATTPIDGVETPFDKVGYKRSLLMDIYNMALPYFRPTDQEGLNPNQLAGEMYAMSNNHVDPVQAQTYQPNLSTPYDISYQDQLNANQSDYRSTERLVSNNPAALAILNANKYSANEKVLGEQFRQNQAMKDRVYNENRNTLNDAKLKNLSIYDQQYERQSTAVSKTKATTQAAINSISDKYAKNKLENRTLGIYENMYNYRYDKDGRAINYNGLFQANIPTVGATNTNPIPGPNGTLLYPQYKNGKLIGYLPPSKATTTGSNIPSNATPPYVPSNGGKYGLSIAKAMKNL